MRLHVVRHRLIPGIQRILEDFVLLQPGCHGLAFADQSLEVLRELINRCAGGNVSGEISHCDFLDTYKLENFDGNAFLLATANGKDAAEVTLSFVKLGADGRKVTIASQTGALKDVVALSASIEESGEFFIEVSGSSYDAEAFSVSNPAEQAFHSYEIDCAVVLIPGETRSRAVAPEGTSTVSMLIEADTLVNLCEEDASREDTESAYEKIFITETGKLFCKKIFDL